MKARLLTVLAATQLNSRCYVMEESGTTTTLKFEPLLVLGVAIVALLGVAIGVAILLRSTRRRQGFAITAFCVLAGAFTVPIMWLNRVVITPTEIYQDSGFWFGPTHKGFRFADVEAIRIQEVKRRRRSSRDWFVDGVGGTKFQISPGDLWESNEDFVVEKLKGYGVTFR